MNLAEFQPFIDEIAEKLPGWWWSLKIKPRSASVLVGADPNGPYASIRKDGFGALIGGPGFNAPGKIATLFRHVIDTALKEKARCDDAVTTASIHLLSYEQRQRR